MRPDQADKIITLLEDIRDRLPKPQPPQRKATGDGARPRGIKTKPFDFNW